MKPFRWVVLAALVPGLALSGFDRYSIHRRSVALERERVERQRALDRLSVVAAQIDGFRNKKRRYEWKVRAIESLAARRAVTGAGPALASLAVALHAIRLDVDSVWARDGFLEVRSRHSPVAALNLLGQTLQAAGTLAEFHLRPTGEDGRLALSGKLATPPRGSP